MPVIAGLGIQTPFFDNCRRAAVRAAHWNITDEAIARYQREGPTGPDRSPVNTASGNSQKLEELGNIAHARIVLIIHPQANSFDRQPTDMAAKPERCSIRCDLPNVGYILRNDT